MLTGLLASPWVQKVILPIVAEIFLRLWDRCHTDPAFLAHVKQVALRQKTAATPEESDAVAKDLQDIFFPSRK